MKAIAIGLTAMLVAGCVQKLPGIVTAAETRTTITLRVLRIVSLQRVETAADEHCAKAGHGLLPHLVDQREFDENYISFRYECQSVPAN